MGCKTSKHPRKMTPHPLGGVESGLTPHSYPLQMTPHLHPDVDETGGGEGEGCWNLPGAHPGLSTVPQPLNRLPRKKSRATRYELTTWLAAIPTAAIHPGYQGPKVPVLTANSMFGSCNATGRILEFLSLTTKNPHEWILKYAATQHVAIRNLLRQLGRALDDQKSNFRDLELIFRKAIFPIRTASRQARSEKWQAHTPLGKGDTLSLVLDLTST